MSELRLLVEKVPTGDWGKGYLREPTTRELAEALAERIGEDPAEIFLAGDSMLSLVFHRYVGRGRGYEGMYGDVQTVIGKLRNAYEVTKNDG